MSLDDVSHDEMDERRHDQDDGFERLLEGSAQARERVPELAVFVDDLQLISTVSPTVGDLHVAAMMSEAVHLLADKGDPAVRSVSNAHGPASQASGLPTRRSVQMKTLLAKVMAPLVAVFTVMGGLAYAEALPGPVQKAVSGAAGAVGIDLPDGSGDATETDDPADVDVDDEGDDVRGDEDHGEDVSDDQGENADGQGENGDDQGENEDQGDDGQGESDDSGQEGDDQGESEDDQGENEDNHGENEDDGGSVENDGQGDDAQGESDDSGDGAGSDDDQGTGSGSDED